MSNELIQKLIVELAKAEKRVQALSNAISALNGNGWQPAPPKKETPDWRLKALEKARAVRWGNGNNKYAGRKAKLDKALNTIFVQQGSRFTINQTMQVLTNKHGITQRNYKDRHSFGSCVRHGLMALVEKGAVRFIKPAEAGTKEAIWETIQPELPIVKPHETHEVSEL